MNAETKQAYDLWTRLANLNTLTRRVTTVYAEEQKQARIVKAMRKYKRLLAQEQSKPYFPR